MNSSLLCWTQVLCSHKSWTSHDDTGELKHTVLSLTAVYQMLIIIEGSRLLSGANYIKAVKIRGNLWHTRARASRGRTMEALMCDAGCNARETLGHQIQNYYYYHLDWWLVECKAHIDAVRSGGTDVERHVARPNRPRSTSLSKRTHQPP